MPRTDRLFALSRLLRDGRLHRAEDLARKLGVSRRQVYRDLDTLIASGVPVAGERGLGYMATAEVTLPPLNLTLAEMEALQLGLAVVAEGGDAELRAASRSLSQKLDAVLPEGRPPPASAPMGLAVGAFAEAARGFRHMPAIRAAIRARQKLRLAIPSDPAAPVRVVRPLRLDYWGRVWTATVWCETTQGFADLRVDLIEAATPLPQLFVDEPGRRLADRQAASG
jgi:predicted DNA-binding transcriptional regulator YafY